MVKILVLTKFLPKEVSKVVETIHHQLGAVAFPFSPILITQMASEAEDIPFANLFYPTLEMCHKEREKVVEYAAKEGFDMFVNVGTDTFKSWTWYDAVIGFNDPESKVGDVFWAMLEEDFNVAGHEFIKLSAAEVTFDSLGETLKFIQRIYNVRKNKEKRENEL